MQLITLCAHNECWVGSAAAELFEFTVTLVDRLDRLRSLWMQFLVGILFRWGMWASHVAQSYLLLSENTLSALESDKQNILHSSVANLHVYFEQLRQITTVVRQLI